MAADDGCRGAAGATARARRGARTVRVLWHGLLSSVLSVDVARRFRSRSPDWVGIPIGVNTSSGPRASCTDWLSAIISNAPHRSPRGRSSGGAVARDRRWVRSPSSRNVLRGWRRPGDGRGVAYRKSEHTHQSLLQLGLGESRGLGNSRHVAKRWDMPRFSYRVLAVYSCLVPVNRSTPNRYRRSVLLRNIVRWI